MQAEMRRYDAEHPIADQKVCVDRAARLVAGNTKLDRTGSEHREAR
jgi:hypothetical protein